MTTKRFFLLALAFFAAFTLLDGSAFAQAAGQPDNPYAATTAWALPALAYFLGLGLAASLCATGLGKAVSAALESIARQPEAAGDIRLSMIIGCALIEALTIYVLISPFLSGGLFKS